MSLGDWFEYVIGPPAMDFTTVPYGGARYPVELEWTNESWAGIPPAAGIGDVVMQPAPTRSREALRTAERRI